MMLYWFAWGYRYNHNGTGQSWVRSKISNYCVQWSGACTSDGEWSGVGRDDSEQSFINYLEE